MKFIIESFQKSQVTKKTCENIMQVMDFVRDKLNIKPFTAYVFNEKLSANSFYFCELPKDKKVNVETYDKSPISDFNNFRNAFIKNGSEVDCEYKCLTKDLVFKVKIFS